MPRMLSTFSPSTPMSSATFISTWFLLIAARASRHTFSMVSRSWGTGPLPVRLPVGSAS